MNSYITEYNKKEYDYSQIDVNYFVSYCNKHYKSLDELLKCVFVTTWHYSNIKFEYNPNNFIKNEKICIYKWFVVRSGFENAYCKCEILITTHGRALYAVSSDTIGINNMFSSLSTSKEYNFWLSNHNINILKLMLDIRQTNGVKDPEDNQTDTHFNYFERLIKNINGVLENMRYMERHKKAIEFEYPDNDNTDDDDNL
jgi:hypothetical protein